MSLVKKNNRTSVLDIMARKGGEPVVCLTAYDVNMAALVDPHVDVILVGDSLGMVLYGMDSTLGVTLDMMIRHGQAVVRGSNTALVVIDMPFGSYQESPEQAFANCAEVMAQTGAGAIKLEGGVEMEATIKFLVERGIPVFAHVGLKPQSLNTHGGFKAQGREEAQWEAIIEDAKAVARAGAFATVLESVAEPLGKKITEEVQNITIGIGASKFCDGQILVTEDMLGYNSWSPKFAKRFADIGNVISGAVETYAGDVKSRSFPEPENTFSMKKKKT
ncbi:MAG: 3-methyl-2-oxobutanoate hydroxymethyltransferase [Sphingomonadales bacterium]|nr:3-methyl-2-oxobutanoate hydroxymethyltransferase [Sphingomonadales bacterium]